MSSQSATAITASASVHVTSLPGAVEDKDGAVATASVVEVPKRKPLTAQERAKACADATQKVIKYLELTPKERTKLEQAIKLARESYPESLTKNKELKQLYDDFVALKKSVQYAAHIKTRLPISKVTKGPADIIICDFLCEEDYPLAFNEKPTKRVTALECFNDGANTA